jgi:heat shock protein HslJ
MRNSTNPLAGTTWELALPADAKPAAKPQSLYFDDQGRIGGFAGCNTYGGAATITGDRISFSQMFSSKRACLEEGAMQREQQFLNTLAAAERYTQTGTTLTLSTADGATLTFVRAAAR